MNNHASSAPFFTRSVGNIENIRRSVTYHPTVWGDTFLAYNSHLTDILPNEEQERQILREEVNKLLVATPNDSLLKLDLIDAIQHLGVGYHFVTEIEKSLKYVYDTCESYGKQDNDLHATALRFRLLRQQGYFVLCAALAGINGELVSKEAFEWVSSDPLILQASEIIGRLMNDLVGFGFEQKISAVECYMNQNKGASEEEAFAEIQKLVTNAWIDINQEWLRLQLQCPWSSSCK